MIGYLFNTITPLCKVVPYFDDLNIFKYWRCYQKSVKMNLLNSSVALRSRHSLFGWMHEGVSSLKYHVCWLQRKLLFLYCILHIYSLTLLNNMQMIIISPKSLMYVPSLCTCGLLSQGFLWWFLVVNHPKIILDHSGNWENVGITGLVTLQFSFLVNV